MTENIHIPEGQWKQAHGKRTEDAGKFTGNKLQEIKGKGEQVAGKIQEEVGKAVENVKKEATED
jgi:uncharacterized protein YjbJ (UPF0337 family)